MKKAILNASFNNSNPNSLENKDFLEKNQENTLNELIESLNLTKELNCHNFKDFKKKFDGEMNLEALSSIEKAQKVYLYFKF